MEYVIQSGMDKIFKVSQLPIIKWIERNFVCI